MKRFVIISLLLHALLLMNWHAPWSRQADGMSLQTLRVQLQASQRIMPDHSAQQKQRTTTAHSAEHVVADRAVAVRTVPSAARSRAQAAADTVAHLPAEPQVPATDAETSQKTALGNVRAALAHALRASFSYPRRARLRGWEGTVVIALRILPDGAITDVRVSDSSGIGVLDEAAIRSISAVQIPEAVTWMDGHELAMLIPVEYRLTDG